MFWRCGPVKSRRPQGYIMTACLGGTRRRTRLGVVIHRHVIRLQMRAEGARKRITVAAFAPGLCFPSHVEKTARCLVGPKKSLWGWVTLHFKIKSHWDQYLKTSKHDDDDQKISLFC